VEVLSDGALASTVQHKDLIMFLIIAAVPAENKEQHAGGQLTASTLLLKYFKSKEVQCKTIDTSQNVFPKPPKYARIFKLVVDMLRLFYYLLRYRFEGAIVFSSAGLSFYEKSIYCFICRCFRVKSALFVRSGHFMNDVYSAKGLGLKKFFLRFPTFIVSQGSNWCEMYAKYFSMTDKVHLIHNWFDLNAINSVPATVSNTVTFLYCGWLVEKKGINELVRVSVELQVTRPNFRFLLVGGGTLYADLKARKEAGELMNVELIGWLDKAELDAYYKKADVFVLPTHAEGFPNVILEAMSYALPIVTTKVGAIEDSVIDGQNGYCIEPKDEKALLSSIVSLGDDKVLRDAFASNALDILKANHDSEKNCQQVIDMFQ
jgi:glycosyltransferase involved in cell wall biosynthesis